MEKAIYESDSKKSQAGKVTAPSVFGQLIQVRNQKLLNGLKWIKNSVGSRNFVSKQKRMVAKVEELFGVMKG